MAEHDIDKQETELERGPESELDEELDDELALEDELEEELGFDEELEEDLEFEENESTEVMRDLSAPIVPAPGCAVSFHLDNKRHHAVCLAVIGDELLLEHKGASRCYLFTGKIQEIVPRLRKGVVSATIIVGGLKPCNYRSVPKKWLKRLVRTGQTWKGIERGGGLAPRPDELMKDDGQLDLF